MAVPSTITVAIPAYNRHNELAQLLKSIIAQQQAPHEVLICEDCSPEREQIRSVVDSMRSSLEASGCRVTYLENEKNLGYDGNLRRLFREAAGERIMLIGNDDVLLPNAIAVSELFFERNPEVCAASRSFVRFSDDIGRPLGVSRLSNVDQVFSVANAPPRMLFRLGAFVGGLLFNTSWARDQETSRYDGGLYYQIYLMANAFCQRGIGYISEPIVGGRAGNPPLFGAAEVEKDVHTAGAYSPKGRAKMWRAVLTVVRDAEIACEKPLLADVRHELMVRQAFHVFEMNASAGTATLNALREELHLLGLYRHPFPMALYWTVRLFGKRSRYLFQTARSLMQ